MSRSISTEEVRTSAALARLTLSEEEVAVATRDLSRVLEHFSSLQLIDTASVPESTAITGRQNVVREDKAEPAVLGTPAQLLERAPHTDKNLVKVPAVF